MISLIWAMDKNGLIGNDNKLPWHYKEDLLYFRNTIKNHKVVMGRKTYESILGYRNGKPFNDVKHLIVTKNTKPIDNAILINDFESFLKEKHDEEIFICGGTTIYELSLPYADKLYITFIDREYEGDSYFPRIDYSLFSLASEQTGIISDELKFRIYERNK